MTWNDANYQRARANNLEAELELEKSRARLKDSERQVSSSFGSLAVSREIDEEVTAESFAAQNAAAHHRMVARQNQELSQALVESRALVAEWQAAMEAWRDLAQTLRDEIKACPNHEAHRFGKDKEAVNQRLTKVVNEGRTKRGLKPFQDN